MNGPSEKQFPALKVVMILYKSVAVLIGIGTMLSTIVLFLSISRDVVIGGVLFLFGGILGSLLLTAIIYAAGDLIGVLLSIESRLYRSEQMHFHMLRALNKLSNMDEKNKNMY